MRYCKNENGIALMLALVLSFIALSMLSVLIYFITQETEMSGLQKRYQTAREAAQGGIQLAANEFVPSVMGSQNVPALTATLAGTYAQLSLAFPLTCLQTKLLNPTSLWGACSTTLDPTDNSDITLTLAAVAPGPPFKVSLKVVDTVPGNTDTSGLDLQGLGVVDSGSGMISPAHDPYLYRIEVRAERTFADPSVQNPGERSNFTVLYGY